MSTKKSTTALRFGAVGIATALALSSCAAGVDPDAATVAGADIASCDPAETALDVAFGKQAEAAMTIAVESVISRYPGLTINAEPQQTSSYDDLTKQIVADISVGARPDLIMAGLGQLRFWVDTYKPVPIDVNALPETYQSQFLGAGTVDGAVYLAPAQISAPVLVVNDSALESNGVTTTQFDDYDDVIDAAEDVTARTSKPSVSIPTDILANWFSQAFVQAAGESFVAADGTAGFGTETGVEALSVWSRLARSDLDARVGLQDAAAQFATGELAFMVTTTSLIATLSSTIGEGFEWRAIDLPSVNGEQGALPAGGNGWIVLSEDPCAAAFSSALVGELLSTEAVLAASGEAYSYLPVDSRAAETLLSSAAATPQLTYAWSYDKPLTTWGGFDGERTPQINDLLRTMAEKLSEGAEPEDAVSETIDAINALVAE